MISAKRSSALLCLCLVWLCLCGSVLAWNPPQLPGGQTVVTDTDPKFLQGPPQIHPDVEISTVVPTVDFMYYPGQTYVAEWSAWGDHIVASNGKYYSSIGDHGGGPVNSYVHEYDPATKTLRQVVDVSALLNLPKGYYTPGKIHGRIDEGKDGWLYFATYHGMHEATTDQYHYNGDWILRYNLKTEKSEIVCQGPAGKRTIYGSIIDPDRLIFYGIALVGANFPPPGPEWVFFAYNLQARKLLYSAPMSNHNDLLFAKSTGRVYYVDLDQKLHRYGPETGQDVPLDVSVGNLFATTDETADGFIYAIDSDSTLYSFNTKTEKVENLGSALVGTQGYITNLDVDPTGKYLYYMPGADGSSTVDGSPVVQFDIKTRKKKILAFLSPFYRDKYGFMPISCFGAAVDPAGDKLYITWHGNNQGVLYKYEACALTVVHIPKPAGVSLPPKSKSK